MSDYTQTTDFSAKDALPSGNPAKLIKGSDFDTELDAVSTAVATKYDSTDLASQAQAEAESSNAVLLTPLRLANWADANGGMAGDIQALADPGADGLLGWDDSASAVAVITPDTTTVTISGTTLSTGANVPLLNAVNTFSGATQKITAADPAWRLRNSSGGSNTKVADIVSTSDSIVIRHINDAENSVTHSPFTYNMSTGVLALTGAASVQIQGVTSTDYARLSQNNTFTGVINAFTNGGVTLGSTADQATLLFSGVAGAESGDQGYVDFGAGSTSQLRLFGYDSSAATFRSALVFNVATGTMALGDGTNSITLNGVAYTDFARLSQANAFTAAQTVTIAGAANSYSFTNSSASITGRLGAGTAVTFLGAETNHPLHFFTNNTNRYEISEAGAHDFKSGTMTTTGAVTFATVANSTSTTLVAGQLHFVSGDATLPNLTAGQWIQIINDDSSAHTISVNGSDTTFWSLTGATVGTSFTLAARGKLTAVCNPAGTAVYVSGSGITGAS